jgi:pyruvate,water dikinase
MVSSYTKDFQVTWDDPKDAEQTWLFDPMHLPAPITPMLAEFWERLMGRYMGMRCMTVNGYAYASVASPRPPSKEMMERGVVDVWNNDFMPAIRKACDKLRRTDYESMTVTQLADAIDAIIHDAVIAFGYTMKPITAFMGPTFGMVQFLADALGPDGPQMGATLLQGFENGTAAAGAGLSSLAEDAAQRPAVADAIRKGNVDGIENVEGGADFMKRFRAYLDDFGWRVDSWGTLEKPTWAENPKLPLTLIGHYIADPQRSPAASLQRSVQQREDAVREIEGRIPEASKAQFREMLQACQSHVSISEGRALWQLIITGSLRVPALALGRKLAAAGALNKPEQVFFFTSGELRDAARNPSAAFKAEADRREAEFEECKKLTPPPFLGSPPDPNNIPPEVAPLLNLFFGLHEPEVKGREIVGRAASKGVVKGTARVIRDLSEAERLKPGEILVCQTTAPPWTPLFAIASAVVTDSGGVLSHSAICAREYAIPCVVASVVGTAMIADGATILVDGTQGIVQLLD